MPSRSLRVPQIARVARVAREAHGIAGGLLRQDARRDARDADQGFDRTGL